MHRETKTTSRNREDDEFFLPGFCDIRMVFVVVLMAELFALVLSLATSVEAFWSRLGLISLFLQWIALGSATLLCLVRPVLRRMSNLAAALVSYLLLLLTTAIISEIAFRVAVGRLVPEGGIDHAEFVLRNLGISAVISALALRYLYVQHQWRQQTRAEAHARLQALQARIRPHFLFNSLNSIASLTRLDAERAEAAVQDLSDMFRVSLRDAGQRVTLEDEVNVAKRYLRMEQLRLGDRLRVDWRIDTLPMKRMVPSLILQPLLENAVYHGIESLPQGGEITIDGEAVDRRINLVIRNPRAQRSLDAHRKGNQLALENIRLRLQLAFGSKAGVALRELDDTFETTLYFPREKMQ